MHKVSQIFSFAWECWRPEAVVPSSRIDITPPILWGVSRRIGLSVDVKHWASSSNAEATCSMLGCFNRGVRSSGQVSLVVFDAEGVIMACLRKTKEGSERVANNSPKWCAWRHANGVLSRLYIVYHPPNIAVFFLCSTQSIPKDYPFQIARSNDREVAK